MDDRQPSTRLGTLADDRQAQYVLLGAGLDSFAYGSPLAGRLAAAGFDLGRPALVSWLGVSMYLTAEAVVATLAAVGGLAVAEQVRQRDAVPPALWDRSDALRPLDLCRLARATVAP